MVWLSALLFLALTSKLNRLSAFHVGKSFGAPPPPATRRPLSPPPGLVGPGSTLDIARCTGILMI